MSGPERSERGEGRSYSTGFCVRRLAGVAEVYVLLQPLDPSRHKTAPVFAIVLSHPVKDVKRLFICQSWSRQMKTEMQTRGKRGKEKLEWYILKEAFKSYFQPHICSRKTFLYISVSFSKNIQLYPKYLSIPASQDAEMYVKAIPYSFTYIVFNMRHMWQKNGLQEETYQRIVKI